jgi:trimethylamine--corrinoid protein Co-methyltransferase
LAGANLIYGLGMLESGVTFDFGQLVMDDEFAAMIKHVVGGIPVNDDTLMVDEIDGVASFGDFLSLDSTLRFMRSLSQPRLLDRRVRDDWTQRGSTDLHQRATKEAIRILDEHRPPALPDEIADELGAIIEATEQKLGVA